MPISDHREGKKEFKLRGYRQKMRKTYLHQSKEYQKELEESLNRLCERYGIKNRIT
ncbi:MAG: hypothetical protein ABIK21_04665 [bacterium]